MPAKVILRVVRGKLTGKDYVYDERTTCIVGRAPECAPRLPDDEDHRTIGRRHCLLDINPPDIRVRDFGSLNGTYVNGKKIGQRLSDQTPEDAARSPFPEYDLKDGDEVELGSTVFRVSLFEPACCSECLREIAEQRRDDAQVAPGVYRCDECRDERRRPRRPAWSARQGPVCSGCGVDLANVIGATRPGDILCDLCKEDPLQIARSLMKLANAGDETLKALSGYELVRELGRGGMGAVFLIRQARTGALLALKLMLPQIAVIESAKQKFQREAENTRALKHPHVVELHDWVYSHGIYFFTLEYCEGGSVSELIEARGGKLSVGEAAPLILQALDGLDYAHHAKIPYVPLADGSFGPGRGLVHRDISPSNLFLCGTGQSRVVKVGDYGLAKAFDMAGLSGQTATGTSEGKPWFMPRQQVLMYKYVKPDVDVWAMAATLYYMLTGYYPRDFPGGADVWQVVLQSKPVPVRKRDETILPNVAAVIDRALIDEPVIYFRTAAEFKAALARAL